MCKQQGGASEEGFVRLMMSHLMQDVYVQAAGVCAAAVMKMLLVRAYLDV
jgi:hypothetical protein